MNILGLALRISLFISALLGLVLLLPNGNDYPVPAEINTAIIYFLGQLYAWNQVIPAVTILQVAVIQVLIVLFTRFTWPVILMFMKLIRNITAGS